MPKHRENYIFGSVLVCWRWTYILSLVKNQIFLYLAKKNIIFPYDLHYTAISFLRVCWPSIMLFFSLLTNYGMLLVIADSNRTSTVCFTLGLHCYVHSALDIHDKGRRFESYLTFVSLTNVVCSNTSFLVTKPAGCLPEDLYLVEQRKYMLNLVFGPEKKPLGSQKKKRGMWIT